MVDALHGWENRNLDVMSSRRWAQMTLCLEWFRANRISKARQRFVEGEGGGKHRELTPAANLELQRENL